MPQTAQRRPAVRNSTSSTATVQPVARGQTALTWDQTSSAYETDGSGDIPGDGSGDIPGDGSSVTIATLSVPAGSFILSATIDLHGVLETHPTNSIVSCSVVADNASVADASGVTTVEPFQVLQLPLLGRSTGNASKLDLQCSSDAFDVSADAVLVATKIGVIQ
jgi:hypothetical protein